MSFRSSPHEGDLGDEDSTETPPGFHHVTVLKREVVAAIEPRAGGLYLDVTLGGGGHSEAILLENAECRVIGCDRDTIALAAANERLSVYGQRFQSFQATFSELASVTAAHGLGPFDGLVADLGVSSPQIDDAARGMSFRNDGPLDMRMDRTRGETAEELIARLDATELADVIFHFGDERRSRRIARCIKQASDSGDLTTTLALRRAVVRAVGPARIGGVDPATRTFQAIRIAVNGELDEIKALIVAAEALVAPGGTIAIISFHSLEDRIIKEATRRTAGWDAVTKRPIIASDEEQAENPRSRSAKLRVARRAVAEEADDDS